MSTAPDRIQVKKRLDRNQNRVDAHNSSLANIHFLCLLSGAFRFIYYRLESTFQKFGIPYKRWKTPEVKKYPCNIISNYPGTGSERKTFGLASACRPRRRSLFSILKEGLADSCF